MRFISAAGVGFAYWTLVSHAMVIPRNTTSSNSNSGLLSVLSQAADDPSMGGRKTSSTASSILSLLNNQTGPPSSAEDVGSVQEAHDKISNVYSSIDKDESDNFLLDLVKGLVEGGLIPPNLVNLLDGYIDFGLNSIYNNNPPPLSKRDIYPKKRSSDATYSTPEEKLRAAIHIPDSFAFGKDGKKPVILVPGTGVPAGTTYHFSFGQLSKALPDADVVWVNIPRASLNDTQTNGEYVAYAINYISAISSGSSVSVISWSQGGLDTQWALKYWPSTRDVVEDFIPISPDFHGTSLRSLVCPLLDPVACTPSIWQQGSETDFIHTLRSDDGDSAYVPTTSVYSSFDEIVQPMSGPNASAILSDIRNVGVTNNHIQTICLNQPAGGIYLHEGVLYNSLAWALAVDALTHDGPGDPSRIDLDTVCGQLLAPQLRLDDMLGTEGLLLVALVEILAYEPKVGREPSIVNYAS